MIDTNGSPMTIIRLPKSWEIPEREVTPETVFLNRRRFFKTLIGAGVGATSDADSWL
jgi:sulfoxide reductase catalytic subunit YedY